MRKWTYLVATLLMAGTTATFTGCIDTDEPEGIVDLRGAKSELIKAQAAVKLVEVEWQKAQVAYQELVNKSKELDNQYKEYDVQMHALDVKLKELEVERAQAATEQAKAEAEAKIAEANRDKAYWENKMAEEAEIFKAAMLNYQTQTAQAQEAYDNAMKLIEAGKLLLSDGEKAIIDKAQQRLYVASASLNQYYDALKTAQDNYYDALVNPDLPTLASLQAELKLAQIAVEKAEILLDEKNNMLALAEDFDAAAWDDKILDLKKKKSEYESEKSKADVEIATIKTSADYKAAEQKVAEKIKARKAAKEAYDKAVADSTTQVNTQLDIAAYKSEPINEGLRTLFSSSNDFTSLDGYTVSTGVFDYLAVQYTQTEYYADLKIEDVTARTSKASLTLMKVNAWIDALGKYSVDENGVEWNKLTLAEKEKAAKDAKEKFEKDKRFVFIWQWIRDWGGKRIENYKDELVSNENYSLNLLSEAEKVGLYSKDLISAGSKFDSCEAFYNHGYVLNYDGLVYKCAMHLNDFENCIGEILDSGVMKINKEKDKVWAESYEKIEGKCVGCCFLPICLSNRCHYQERIVGKLQCLECKGMIRSQIKSMINKNKFIQIGGE